MVKKDLLTRNLERINVEQKPNFHKLLDEFLENDRKSLISTLSIDDQKKDILNKIFVLLNRANHKRTKRSTSPLTAMYGNKFYKLYELLDYDMKDLQLISQDELFQSITGMQAGKGMIKKEDFELLKALCSDEGGKLDKELLKSITGMQNGKGMIKKEDFELLKTLCSDEGGKLDKELLKSITGMQNGKGMIKKEDFELLKAAKRTGGLSKEYVKKILSQYLKT